MDLKYKCCRTKPAPYYFCSKCTSVFHKSCAKVNRIIGKHIKNSLIICKDCDLENDYEKDDNISILEKTVNELSTELCERDKYIDKMKKKTGCIRPGSNKF